MPRTRTPETCVEKTVINTLHSKEERHEKQSKATNMHRKTYRLDEETNVRKDLQRLEGTDTHHIARIQGDN